MLPGTGKPGEPVYKSIFKCSDISSSMLELCPKATDFRVISVLSATSFLILARSPVRQYIVLCSMDKRKWKVVTTLYIHRPVVYARLNPAHDSLILTLADNSLGLSFGKVYTGFCLLVKCKDSVMYPITGVCESVPSIDWFDSGSKILVSTEAGRYETWELKCSQVEFQMKQDGRSKRGIVWWSVENQKLEYICEKNGALALIGSRTLFLPSMLSSALAFRHLSSSYNQDCVVCLMSESVSIVLPKASLRLDVPYHVDKRDYYGDELYKFCAIKNDLVMIFTPERVLHTVLLDGQSQPRAYFALRTDEECREQFVHLTSTVVLTGIDTRTGTHVKMDFDYEALTKQEPRLFLPLLHYSVLSSGKASCIFRYLTYDVLQTFWTGLLFDEYVLMLGRRDLQAFMKPEQVEYLTSSVATFCTWQHFEQELSRFVPYQIETNEKPTTDTIQNWRMLVQAAPELLYQNKIGERRKTPLLAQILKETSAFDFNQVDASVRFFVCLQLLGFQWGLWPKVRISNEMRAFIKSRTSRKVCEFWEQKELMTIGSSYFKKEGESQNERKVRKIEHGFWKMKKEPDVRNFQIFASRDAMTVEQAIKMRGADKVNKDVSTSLVQLYELFLGKDLSGGKGSLVHQYSLL